MAEPCPAICLLDAGTGENCSRERRVREGRRGGSEPSPIAVRVALLPSPRRVDDHGEIVDLRLPAEPLPVREASATRRGDPPAGTALFPAAAPGQSPQARPVGAVNTTGLPRRSGLCQVPIARLAQRQESGWCREETRVRIPRGPAWWWQQHSAFGFRGWRSLGEARRASRGTPPVAVVLEPCGPPAGFDGVWKLAFGRRRYGAECARCDSKASLSAAATSLYARPRQRSWSEQRPPKTFGGSVWAGIDGALTVPARIGSGRVQLPAVQAKPWPPPATLPCKYYTFSNISLVKFTILVLFNAPFQDEGAVTHDHWGVGVVDPSRAHRLHSRGTRRDGPERRATGQGGDLSPGPVTAFDHSADAP